MVTKALVIADTEPVLLPSRTWGCRAWLLQGMGSVAQWPRFPWSFMLWAVLLPRDFPLLLCHGCWRAGAGERVQRSSSKVGSPGCCQLGAAWWAGNAASDTQLLNIVPGRDQRRQGLLLAASSHLPP